MMGGVFPVLSVGALFFLIDSIFSMVFTGLLELVALTIGVFSSVTVVGIILGVA